eukprot:658614-Prymnesium_polylepis.1
MSTAPTIAALAADSVAPSTGSSSRLLCGTGTFGGFAAALAPASPMPAAPALRLPDRPGGGASALGALAADPLAAAAALLAADAPHRTATGVAAAVDACAPSAFDHLRQPEGPDLRPFAAAAAAAIAPAAASLRFPWSGTSCGPSWPAGRMQPNLPP